MKFTPKENFFLKRLSKKVGSVYSFVQIVQNGQVNNPQKQRVLCVRGSSREISGRGKLVSRPRENLQRFISLWTVTLVLRRNECHIRVGLGVRWA
jgi:hypothetical protein